MRDRLDRDEANLAWWRNMSSVADEGPPTIPMSVAILDVPITEDELYDIGMALEVGAERSRDFIRRSMGD